ncbi:MAG: hypothetical protein GX410_09375 [Elusimicrobia bacterium]|nr:hypothetical protein [Elusimicrobiota bacterium]
MADTKKDTESKSGGALLTRIPRVTPSSASRTGLLGRFRGMAKKDVGLMAAAGALMATLPLAENYMMKSEDRGGKAGKSSELFEPNGTVSFGSPGSGATITPLTARDPMSLILSGEDAEKAASPVPDDSRASASKPSDSFRETVREPFQRAVERARAAVPTPKTITFRGMSLGGGGGGSSGGGGVMAAARSAPSSPAHLSGSGAYAPGVHGFAKSVGSYSDVEGLKGRSDNIATRMNRGSAIEAINALGGGGTETEAVTSRPSTAEENPEKSENESKYKLQAPKAKKPAKPGSGSPMQPWFKESKEMEAQGEIDRAKAKAAFEHQSRMEFQKWLRDSIKEAVDNALVNPLKAYMQAAIEKKFSGEATPEPVHNDELDPLPAGDGSVSGGDQGKTEYVDAFKSAQDTLEACKDKNADDSGPVPGVCVDAKDAFLEAVNPIHEAQDSYAKAATAIAQENRAVELQMNSITTAFTGGKIQRDNSLTTAETTLTSLAEDIATLDKMCTADNQSTNCATYRNLNPKQQQAVVAVLKEYNTAVGTVLDNSKKPMKMLSTGLEDAKDSLESGKSIVSNVRISLGSELNGTAPSAYAGKLSSLSSQLGNPDNPASGSAYEIINKASGSKDSETQESDYWKTVQPNDWLTKAEKDLSSPDASTTVSAVPQAYDGSDRALDVHRLQTMQTNVAKVVKQLDSVTKKLDASISTAQGIAEKTKDTFMCIPELGHPQADCKQ